jgi:hypothetical protein
MLETMPCLEAAKVRLDHGYDVCKNGRLDPCGDDACKGCFLYDEGSVFLDGLAEATYLDLSAPSDMVSCSCVPCFWFCNCVDMHSCVPFKCSDLNQT